MGSRRDCGALAFGAGIASLIAGRYTDSLKNKKQIIVYGYLVIGVGFLLYTSVANIWYLAIVQLLIGLVRPLYEPAFDALYSLHLDKDKAGEEWGAWEAMSYFTAAAGAALGGAIVALFNFGTLFVVMSALCMVSAFYVLRLPKKIL